MRLEVAKEIKDLRKRITRLRTYAETFEEEVMVNSIKYAVDQTEKIFKNNRKNRL
jgi:hypothetical protein